MNYFRWVLSNEGGFLHKSFIGRAVGGLAGRGLQFVGAAGIPGLSLAARTVRSFAGGGSRNAGFISARSAAITRGQTTTRLQAQGASISLPPGLTPTGPGGIIGALPGVRGGVSGFAQEPTDGVCPKGFHLNKAEYYLKSENAIIPERSRCVKNRHRNPDNGRASSRAANRLLARKRHSDRIDAALESLVKRRAPRRKKAGAAVHTPLIVQN